MHKDLIFFGIQGCGKGTQAKKLIEAFPGIYSYFSSGDVFRALTMSDNAIGDYIKEELKAGQLIVDNVTIALFNTYLETVIDSEKWMLLDGYPRSKGQIDDLILTLEERNRDVRGIYFELSYEKAIERMLLRGRSDDNKEAIEFRIKQYFDKTKPIIDYFSSRFELIRINADNSVEDIFNDLKKSL